MNRMVGILVVLSSLAGCDPGPEMLEKCQDAVADIPTELPDEGLTLEPGPWEVALRKCQMLANSDSDLAPKGAEIIKDLDARKAGFEKMLVKRREEHDIAERKAGAARQAKADAVRQQEIDSCTSKKWVSACENNGVPQGGAFTRDTPEKCERAAQNFREGFGLKCVKCGCFDDLSKVMSGAMR